MALSNAERQKRYRETRKEKVSELDVLRNELTELKNRDDLRQLGSDILSRANYNYADINRKLTKELEQLRNENDLLRKENQELRAARKKSPKLMPLLTLEESFFYVYEGKLKLLEWPETEGTINAKGLDCVPCSKVDKKYMKAIEQLISEYNEKVRSINADNLNGR